MSDGSEPKLGKRGLLAAVVGAAFLGLAGGAVGGAAGAMWVINTMAGPKVTTSAKNAVFDYDAMPKEGVRPVDIAGLSRNGTPLHPCLIEFLENQEEVVGAADWRKVRLHPHFRDGDDIVNQLAFSRGALGITRNYDIYVNVPIDLSMIDRLSETLMFHELVHVAQYAEGMNLPEYASSAAAAMAGGSRPEDNLYEEVARMKSQELLKLWAMSPQRAACHPDLHQDLGRRAESERPDISFAIFSPRKGEYELVRHQLHKKRLLVALDLPASDPNSQQQPTQG